MLLSNGMVLVLASIITDHFVYLNFTLLHKIIRRSETVKNIFYTKY